MPCNEGSRTSVTGSPRKLQDSLSSARGSPGLPQSCPKGLPIKGPVQHTVYVHPLITAGKLHGARYASLLDQAVAIVSWVLQKVLQ